ncbi:trypsin-1-like [Culicoides brevitarsis]|uniref:trypsin-1-like n=1 Tax=Culicoides brevitarsis TaxID=469753 RepID=UPI00307CB0D0
MKVFTSLLVASAIFASVLANPLQRVVGGEDAAPHEFPYQISIRSEKGTHHCGGSILNENYILTAGHCIVPEGSVVVAGAHNIAKPSVNEQRRKIEKFIVHKDYDGSVGPYDIALIKVDKPFVLNEFVQTIALPESGVYPEGAAVVSGWGSTSRGFFPIFPDVLQKAILPIHTEEDCFKFWDVSPYDKKNVCAGELDGSNSVCSGDSGGPLAQKVGEENVVVGVVSWGKIPCGSSGKPGVFTLVSSFIDWIQENMED